MRIVSKTYVKYAKKPRKRAITRKIHCRTLNLKINVYIAQRLIRLSNIDTHTDTWLLFLGSNRFFVRQIADQLTLG